MEVMGEMDKLEEVGKCLLAPELRGTTFQCCMPLFSASHLVCRKSYTYMKNDVPADVGALSLDTATTNYLCCAIMLKALPSFLVLQLQVVFSTVVLD